MDRVQSVISCFDNELLCSVDPVSEIKQFCMGALSSILQELPLVVVSPSLFCSIAER